MKPGILLPKKLSFPVIALLVWTASINNTYGQDTSVVKNIVLVHGAFVDGSGWQGVYDILIKKGYNVAVAQRTLTSFEGDVAAVKRMIDQQNGPCILVGHSYGGAVVTIAGNDPEV